MPGGETLPLRLRSALRHALNEAGQPRRGTVQRWQSADRLDRCDACNAPLADAPATAVEPALRDGLAFLIGLLDPDSFRRADARAQLPVDLANLDGGLILELALAIAPLAADGYVPPRGSLPESGRSQIAYATALARSADVIRGWPQKFVAAIDTEVAALSRSCNKPRYVGIADYVPSMAYTTLPTPVRDRVLTALEAITAAPGEMPEDQMGMKEAQAGLGVELGVFSDARRKGLLLSRTCLRAGKLFATLDRAEMDHIRWFKANRISAEMASEELELPGYAITLLEDSGRITFETHPFIIARYGNAQLARDEFARFKRRLAIEAAALVPEDEDREEALRVVLGNPVPLHRVARAMGGGFKPWAVIIEKLLNGSVRFAMSGARMSRIWVSADDAEMFWSLNPTDTASTLLPKKCSQRDALEILNLPLRKAAILERLARPNDRWDMEWSVVLGIARERITLTELCARTGLQSKTLLAKIGPANPRHDDFGWWRDEALVALP